MIRIILVDGESLFRAGLRALLHNAAGVSVVGEAESGEQAIGLVRELNPDLVLMDITLPGMGGLETAQRLCRNGRRPGVIAVTGCVEAPFPAQMLKAGALGYLTKNVSQKELLVAIKRVFAGKRYVCNEVAQDLASYAFDEHIASPFETLSHREMQITMMVVNCQKVSEISTSLHLSPKTVNSYRYRIFDKLNVSSDVELALLAVKHGMISSIAHSPLAAGHHQQPAQQQQEQYVG